MPSENRPLVGVAVLVFKDDKILIGRDIKKGPDVYGVPGGHWENGETIKECAMRETKEESGIIIQSNIQLISLYDFYREDKQRSYVSIGMKTLYGSGKLTNLDKEGRLDWNWYTISDALKLNLFPADKILINRYSSGVIFD